MRIALFIPCYVDQLFPQVGIATLRVLEQQGVSVAVPSDQACCGQPFVNAGSVRAATPLMESFTEAFSPYDAIVCPSGSCVSMIRNHYPEELSKQIKIFELCEFLHDELPRSRGTLPVFKHSFARRVALHPGCHGLRELGLGQPSEHGGVRAPGKIETLLSAVPELQLIAPKRSDECCGFGGTFAIMEPELSCAMGRSRLDDFAASGAEVITSADMSCLMHLDGLLRREARPLRVLHIAEILAGGAEL